MIGGSLAALYSLIRATGQTLKTHKVNVGNWQIALTKSASGRGRAAMQLSLLRLELW